MKTRLITRKMMLGMASALASTLVLAQAAQASGFGLRENTADSLGNAFAGAPAKAYDPSTVWTNPAGMALLDDDQVEGAISYIAPSATFTGTATDPLTGSNVSGVGGGNAVAPAASAAAFGVFDLSPGWRLGLSVTAPYGERTSYPANFVGRYQSLVSAITDINLGLALSYKVNDQLSDRLVTFERDQRHTHQRVPQHDYFRTLAQHMVCWSPVIHRSQNRSAASVCRAPGN